MNPQHIRDCIAEIRIAVQERDYERAHSLEDQLRHDFIGTVAETARFAPRDELVEMACLVRSTSDIKFPRYCA